MVTVEEFDAAQRILRRADAPRPQCHEVAFRGVFHCGECGAAITAEKHRKKSGREYVYYHCTKRRGPCRQEGYLRSDDLENQVGTFLERLSLTKPFCDWLIERLQLRTRETRTGRSARLDALHDEIARVSRRMSTLTQLRVNEELQPEDYRRQYNELVREETRLEQKIQKVEEESDDSWLEPAREAVSIVELAKNSFMTGNAEQKCAIIRNVGLNPTIRNKTLLITAKKPFQYLMERSSCPIWSAQEDDVGTFIATLECSFGTLTFTPNTEQYSPQSGQIGTGAAIPQV